jgi:hypothetical protein
MKITRWRDQAMAERWAASAWLVTEKHFHKLDGHRDLWALANILDRQPDEEGGIDQDEPSRERGECWHSADRTARF